MASHDIVFVLCQPDLQYATEGARSEKRVLSHVGLDMTRPVSAVSHAERFTRPVTSMCDTHVLRGRPGKNNDGSCAQMTLEDSDLAEDQDGVEAREKDDRDESRDEFRSESTIANGTSTGYEV